MDSVLRALVMYAFMWLVFRINGKRSLSQVTTFDFVLLLIISETTQQAMVDDDRSMTHAFLLVVTFFTIELGLSHLKRWSPSAGRVIDSSPVLVFANGRTLPEPLNNERLEEADILEAARENHGLERLDQIKYAILECGGQISIVPHGK